MKISRREFILASAASGGALAVGANTLVSSNVKPAPSGSLSFSGLARKDFTRWTWRQWSEQPSLSAVNSEFSFQFEPVIERRPYNFRYEVLRACEQLDRRRQGKTLAVCVSGGIDSEVLVSSLHELGIPLEMYFLNNWGHNSEAFEQGVRPLSRKLNLPVEVVHLDREYFMKEYALKTFEQIACEGPTNLMLTYLFKNIPKDRFIVTGAGGLDRVGDLYSYIGNRHPITGKTPGVYVPMSLANVAYDIWAQTEKREGEWYFFHSTPELLAATILDPRFKASYPFAQTDELLKGSFPEVLPRPKTTNWDTPLARSENAELRLSLMQHSLTLKTFENWQLGFGASCLVDRIFA